MKTYLTTEEATVDMEQSCTMKQYANFKIIYFSVTSNDLQESGGRGKGEQWSKVYFPSLVSTKRGE